MSTNSEPVIVIINNTTTLDLVPLTSFKSAYLYYDPTIHQIILKNQHTSDIYYGSYTMRGNTNTLGEIPYTPVPQSGGSPITVMPGQTLYFTPSGQQEGGYNVETFNSKVIWDDMTLTDGNGNYFQCNANNQNVGVNGANVNRILMACLTLTAD